MFVFPRQLIFWTSVLIAAVGGVEALTFMQPLAPEKETYHSAAYLRAQRAKHLQEIVQERAITKDETIVAKKTRSPASDDAEEFSAIALDDHNSQQAVDLTLGCSGQQSSQFAKGVTQVRLSGTSCAAKSAIVSSEIHNESNGTTATVFLTTPTTFMTDYITLQPGPNKIHIVHTFKKDPQESRDYTITRTQVGKKI